MPRDDLSKFPPLPDKPPPFPTEPPLARGLAELCSWWLDVKCPCRQGLYVLPLRLLAARVGWRVPLAAVLPRLRCKECNGPPSSVELIENPAYGAPGTGTAPGKRLRLV